ncbi:hypothetical protein [Microbacterium sp. NPDC064584]|uniref:hypothetical protein n=1 Tax=Microbacterium sp. NPDC064584 TaxID=3155817 RepID=UPI00341CA86C
MSDDLDIRGGGPVAVDTVSLRDASAAFAVLAADLDEIATSVAAAGRALWDASTAIWGPAETVEGARRLIAAAVDQGNGIVRELRLAADVYELIELRAERAVAAAADDAARVAQLDARIGGLLQADPDVDGSARREVLAHGAFWPAELARQAPGALWWLAPGFGSVAAGVTWTVLQGIGATRAGAVASTARLRGVAEPVVVSALARPAPVHAPVSLADAAARMPSGQSRIRVERYEMADGSRQFAVYVTGTRTIAPGTTEPFDMESNIELYSGERSASYDATLAALRDAGAHPGDMVHAFGHSQGAMVTAHLAVESGYDTATLVSFGSPVEADVDAGTLSVTLRHRDDPVTALAGGGNAPVGAPGSFVAERTADPAGGVHDFGIPGHGIDTYAHTARLLDDSADPRMDAVREVFAGLAGAASAEVIEYAAVRVPAVPAPEPGPAAISPGASGAG